LGVGPSAHSFFYNAEMQIRTANHASLTTYLATYLDEQRRAETLHQNADAFREELSPEDIFNETVLLSLRQASGLDIDKLENWFNFAAQNVAAHRPMFYEKVSDLMTRGLMVELVEPTRRLRLTPKGFSVADTVASDLFI
jgi:coproporphyrinogen III oxidase-like Fe-S oxidoreductase